MLFPVQRPFGTGCWEFCSCPSAGLNLRRLWMGVGVRSRHGVMPLLLRGLRAACWESVPEDVRSKLERFAGSNARRNFVLTS